MTPNHKPPPSRRQACLALLAGASAPRALWAQAAPALEVGVLPNISARVLLAQYQPLRVYLERETRRPVQVSTAPNWATFHERTLALEYELIVTAGHMARLAQLDRGYVPLLSYAPNIKGLIAYAKARPLKHISELRGQTLVLSNAQSLVTFRGLRWLAENGLQPGRDFRTINVPTDDSVGNVVVRGDAIAAMLSSGEYRATPEPIKADFQIMTAFAEVPSFVVLASPRLSAAAAQALKRQLLAFANGAEEGKAFFGNTGFTGMVEPAAGLMEAMDAYVDVTRKALAPPRS